jgi:hypothetical protein
MGLASGLISLSKKKSLHNHINDNDGHIHNNSRYEDKG